MFLLRLIGAVVRALFAKRTDLVGDAAILPLRGCVTDSRHHPSPQTSVGLVLG